MTDDPGDPAAIGHALGNALTCLLGYLALAQEHAAEARDVRLDRHLEGALEQAQRAGALAVGLIGRTRPRAAPRALRRSSCSSTSTQASRPRS
jgi:hypothetical protein